MTETATLYILKNLPEFIFEEFASKYGSKRLRNSSLSKKEAKYISLSSSFESKGINPIKEFEDPKIQTKFSDPSDLKKISKSLLNILDDDKLTNNEKKPIHTLLKTIEEKLDSLKLKEDSKKNGVINISNENKEDQKIKRKLFLHLFRLMVTSLLKDLAELYFSKKAKKKGTFKKNDTNAYRLFDFMIKQKVDPTKALLEKLASRGSSTDKKVLNEVLANPDFSEYHSVAQEYLFNCYTSRRVKEHTKRIKRTNTGGFVYFIKEIKNSDQHQAHIKIGYTNNLDRRLSEFVVSVPYPLEFIHSIYSENAAETERLFHSLYQNKHINGEWFELNQDNLLAIKLLKLPEPILKSITGDYYDNISI